LALLFFAGCGSTPPPSPTSSVVQAPSPSHSPPGQSPSPSPTDLPQEEVDLLPTPSTTDVVLLVTNDSALTAREQVWLDDLRADLGRVDAMAYRQATRDSLTRYFTVFVIDQSPDLDLAALSSALQAGVTIHLVGAASSYEAQLSEGSP
jgi:hypothetical protein